MTRSPGVLQRYMISTDHDGMELELSVSSFDEFYALVSTLLLLAAVPASLGLVGLPAASWFEHNRWWLVNEGFMAEIWWAVGALFAGLFWLMWPVFGFGKPYHRIRIEQHRLVLKSNRSQQIIPTRDLKRVWVGARGLRLEKEDGTNIPIELPLQDKRLLRELANLIVKHAEQSGSPDAIPESLQELRGRPGAVSSPEQAR